jgi:hypothetical protein
MKVKANDLFESYLQTICNSKAQFEAINNLHKLYFESEMGKEVEVDDDECCKDGKCCKDGECCEDGKCCKEGECKCEKGINEAIDGGLDIQAEADKNGLTVPEYEQALDMFLNQ